MEIKILGSGCMKCNKLYELVQEAVRGADIKANIEKVTSFKDIASYGVMKTPGLVINGAVKASGRIPSRNEIKKLLSE